MIMVVCYKYAGVVELEYTAIFKIAVLPGNCGFEPHRPQSADCAGVAE